MLISYTHVCKSILSKISFANCCLGIDGKIVLPYDNAFGLNIVFFS